MKVRLTVQTPAGFEWQLAYDDDNGNLDLADQVSLAEALVDEWVDAGFDVLSAVVNNVAMSEEWIRSLDSE